MEVYHSRKYDSERVIFYALAGGAFFIAGSINGMAYLKHWGKGYRRSDWYLTQMLSCFVAFMIGMAATVIAGRDIFGDPYYTGATCGSYSSECIEGATLLIVDTVMLFLGAILADFLMVEWPDCCDQPIQHPQPASTRNNANQDFIGTITVSPSMSAFEIDHSSRSECISQTSSKKAPEQHREMSYGGIFDDSDDETDDIISYSNLSFKSGEIGRGSFGIVKEASWKGQEVAVKELGLSLSQDALAALHAEAHTLRSLRHPCIVAFYGYCESPPCIVMELCSDSLSNILEDCVNNENGYKAKEMTWSRRLQLALDIAKGMKFLHLKEYYHRDLRSGNILITDRYQAKVADMGLTRKMLDVRGRSAGTMSMTSPRYLAPELLKDESFTSKSDVYGFGTILLELATWETPWKDLNDYQIPLAIFNKNQRLALPTTLSSLPGPTPVHGGTFPKFKVLTQRCLSLSPGDRPDFSRIVNDLQKILEGECPGSLPQTQAPRIDEPRPGYVSELKCCVCMINSPEYAYTGCGHRCICRECSEDGVCSTVCPICRVEGRPIRIYAP